MTEAGRYRASIVIPLFNKVEYTVRCLTTLAECTPADQYEVVLVDNGSTDATPDLCAGLDGDVQVIRNDVNQGFAVACNQGARAAQGRHLLFLNNDTELLPGWFEPLVDRLDAEPDVDAVGAKLLFPDDTIQHAGVVIVESPIDPLVAIHRWYRHAPDSRPANVRDDVEVVTAACVAVRRAAFDEVGGFDEGYWNGYEDVDLCLKLRARGGRVVYEPASVLYHHESISGPERFRRVDDNVRRLQARWSGRARYDALITPEGVTRGHPSSVRLRVVVRDHGDRRATRATIQSILPQLRGTDWLVQQRGSVLVHPEGPGRDVPGEPDWELEIDAGLVLPAPGLDRLAGFALDPTVGAAGPLLEGGSGAQDPARWEGSGLDNPPRRSVHVEVAQLDRRCRLVRRQPATTATCQVVTPDARAFGRSTTTAVAAATAAPAAAPAGAVEPDPGLGAR